MIEGMSAYKKFLISLVGLLLLSGLFYVASLFLVKPSTAPPAPEQNTVTLSGKTVCLPHKNQEGPQTLECAFGLLTDDNAHYGLRGNNAAVTDTNMQIDVTGAITAPAENELYDVVGNIEVESITQK
jgi:hypothetical protein